MRTEVSRPDCCRALPGIGIAISLFCGLPQLVLTDTLRGSDLQASTDSAAADAKRDLCIALNRSQDTSKLAEKFFEFYEGKIVSATQLHPDTFETGQIGPLPRFRVAQVLGPNETLASIGSMMFKLKNFSTADVADDQSLLLPSFFLVRGTETYDTVAGSTNTVYVLEPAKGNLPAVKPTRVYPWYNRRDEVVVTGEFTIIRGSKAVFLVDGQHVSVPLTKFTPGDRDLMRIIMDRYPQAQAPDKATEPPPEKSPDKPAPLPVGID
ncbi:MAG: hypothetical protein ACKO1M_14070 [Planctomycetota bacterium]